MAEQNVPQEPVVEPDAIHQNLDPDEAPQPPEPGPGADQPTAQPDAVNESAGQWDTPEKPGGNVEDSH